MGFEGVGDKAENPLGKLKGKGNHFLMVRIDKEDKIRLEAMAKAEGFKSISEWVRYNLLHPSLEAKVNRILQLLEPTKKIGDINGKFKG